MKHRKKMIILSALTIIIAVCTAANVKKAGKFKNLKVLPADISEQKLDSLMDAYNKALKVSCDFCHSKPKNLLLNNAGDGNELDFALDNQMKEDARRMIKLTIDINKTYFNFDSTKTGIDMNVVSCNTCHRGNPYPAHE
ncbi:MAG: c-type cytochrome [Ferruginibacter sp.]